MLVSCRHLCEAEALTEVTAETQKSAGILSYGKDFQRSNQQILPKRRAWGDTKQALTIITPCSPSFLAWSCINTEYHLLFLRNV